MTRPEFGARAPETRQAWLLARFIRREPVRYEPYRRRFGGSAFEFRSDIARIRRARIRRGTTFLGA